MTSPRALRVRDVREEVMRLDGYRCRAQDIDPHAGPCVDRWGEQVFVVLPNDLEMDYVRRGSHGKRHELPQDHVMLCPGHHRGAGAWHGAQWATAHRQEMRAWLDNGRR